MITRILILLLIIGSTSCSLFTKKTREGNRMECVHTLIKDGSSTINAGRVCLKIYNRR